MFHVISYFTFVINSHFIVTSIPVTSTFFINCRSYQDQLCRFWSS